MQNLFASTALGLSKPRVALKALARVLDLMAADVVALQEVADAGALAELNERLREPYPHTYSIHGNSQRGIHLAYLSRLPLVLSSHADIVLQDEAGEPLLDRDQASVEREAEMLPVRLQRDLLQAEVVQAGEPTLTLFNVHLKSKFEQAWRSLSSDAIRLAEARAVAAQVQAYASESTSRCTVLLGDFNDQLVEPSLLPLRQLNWFDGQADDHAQQKRTGRVPGTYWSKRRRRIDYILLNGAAQRRLQPGSVRVHASTLAQRASDHYPLSVDLDIG